MVDHKCNACAMEVSSHALALSRVEAVKFSAVAFTNLTRDHLDFHGDMSSYFSVKRRLFKMINEKVPAVIPLKVVAVQSKGISKVKGPDLASEALIVV